MAIRCQNWYDLNAARNYPLDDGAICADTRGRRFPTHFLADLYLKYPDTLGPYVYLSAFTITPNVVTLVLLAADSFTAPGVPVASLSLPMPVDKWRQYPLESLYPGVGGWLVFGSGVDDQQDYVARFANASQSRFTPRAAKPYQLLPISSVARLGDTPLTGLVSLLGGNDIEVVAQTREIPGRGLLNCIVVQLANLSSNASLTHTVQTIYSSPCLNTPESGTCPDPQPLQYIGPVPPDCCGNITIKFRGCATVSAITEAATLDSDGNVTAIAASSGVVIDCGLGLFESCVTPDHLPNAQGRLPNDYDDLCHSLSAAPLESISETLGPDIPFSYSEIDDSMSWELGGSASFDFYLASPHAYENAFHDFEWWQVVAGYFGLASGDGFSTHFTDSVAGPNMALCTHAKAHAVYYRKTSAIFYLDQGNVGTSHNAAVLVNVRPDPVNPQRYTAYAAEIDWDAWVSGAKLLRIAYYDGTEWFTLGSVEIPGLALDSPYRLSLWVWPRGDADAWLVAEVVGLTDDTQASVGPVPAKNFGDDYADCGVYTRRSRVRFAWFGIERIPKERTL